ncbi:hypothetical protein [Paraburkholderia elongata]|uniref:hypothetical protein n=1 Tax=Paraburkholderia elongata TaxID=2675747 RepID=UPI0015517E60|nr:hypothetical protein [Paraburkholderia elongata]
MCEQIFAAVIRRDEAQTFLIIEPLDRAGCHLPFLIINGSVARILSSVVSHGAGGMIVGARSCCKRGQLPLKQNYKQLLLVV